MWGSAEEPEHGAGCAADPPQQLLTKQGGSSTLKGHKHIPCTHPMSQGHTPHRAPPAEAIHHIPVGTDPRRDESGLFSSLDSSTYFTNDPFPSFTPNYTSIGSNKL